MTDMKDAVSKAKAALDKIKVTKEKSGEGKDAVERSKIEKPEELEGALGEAKQALDYCVMQIQQQMPPQTDVNRVKVMIDNIGLVRGEAEHVKAAVDNAKAKLDEFAKQYEATQQASKQK